VIHDEYRRSKARENGSMWGMRAVVVIDHAALFAGARKAGAPGVVFSDAQAETILRLTKRDVRTSTSMSAWTVRETSASGAPESMVVLVDHAKELAIIGQEEGEVPDVEKTHLSPICEVYRGMNKDRKVWLCFLCRVPEKGGADVKIVQAGICAQPALPSTSMQMPRLGAAECSLDLLQ